MNVCVEGAAVVILGPDAVAVSLTAAAALRSAAILIEAAEAASRSADQAPILPIEQE